MRQFDTGATRSPLDDKPQYEGYLSPLVVKRFGEYMLKHQTQADGQRRDADNWQLGIDADSLIDSAWRHFEDWWLIHRGYADVATEPLEEALCALIFNASARLKQAVEERLVAKVAHAPIVYPMSDELPPAERCGMCNKALGTNRDCPNCRGLHIMAGELPLVAPLCCPGGHHAIGSQPDCECCEDYHYRSAMGRIDAFQGSMA
jgi:hypothetical protein